jgi:glycosyltransferase involved in cell wall biosynthesis
MRVMVDTTFARRGPTGTGVYLRRLVPALRELGIDVVEAENERRAPPAGGGAGSLRNAAVDRWWTAVELPRAARAAGADVLHHPLPAHAAAPRTPPQVVTVHDLAFERLPDAFDPRFAAFARRVHRAATRRAAAAVCPSHATALDAIALWGVPAERIVVAPHGPGQWDPAAGGGGRSTGAGRGRHDAHFLYVGDDEPRKNVALLLAGYAAYRAAADRPLPLVLAGTARARVPGVHLDHRPPAQRLARLHAGAAALVHPSLHEGFGLVALEAMAAGTPVLAARAPGVTETCGEAARYFDPRDPASLAAGLRALAGDPAERERLRAAGRERVAAFSWERSARAHLRAYTLASQRR